MIYRETDNKLVVPDNGAEEDELSLMSTESECDILRKFDFWHIIVDFQWYFEC